MTADNAANNNTTMREMDRQINNMDPKPNLSYGWDPDESQIRCLTHIQHLAVVALLLGTKILRDELNLADLDDSDLTIEEAEAIVADDNTEAQQADDDESLDGLVDMGSAIDKESITVFSS